jgi:hypothetical protein
VEIGENTQDRIFSSRFMEHRVSEITKSIPTQIQHCEDYKHREERIFNQFREIPYLSDYKTQHTHE